MKLGPWRFAVPIAVAGFGGLLVWLGIVPNPFNGMPYIAATIEATLNPQRQKALDEVSEIAASIESETGFPADAMVAQWAIESSWGEKPVCTHNYFGIKLAVRHKAGCESKTTEIMSARRIETWNEAHPEQQVVAGTKRGFGFTVEMVQRFADYHSLDEACRDYAQLIETGAPYSEAWREYQRVRDVKVLLKGLAGIYWTDPDYVQKAINVMGQIDVKEALAAARARGVPSAPSMPTRGLPPTTVASIAVVIGNIFVALIGFAIRSWIRGNQAELNQRLEGIRSEMKTQLADAEGILQDRTRDSMDLALKANNFELEKFFNGRYIKTDKFNEAHAEQLKHIKAVVEGISGLKPPPTVRLGG